jgi:hypothetical protein
MEFQYLSFIEFQSLVVNNSGDGHILKREAGRVENRDVLRGGAGLFLADDDLAQLADGATIVVGGAQYRVNRGKFIKVTRI